MKDKIEREEEPGIIHLDLVTGVEDREAEEESIIQALTSSEFRYIITEYLFTNLTEAISIGKNSFIAFRLTHQDEDYILEKKQYKNLLNTILAMAEEDEEYTKCAAIQKLIKGL
jgi:hypothetical protein